MARAIESGMRFPRTVLGEAHQWLRATFPPPQSSPPPQTNGEAGEEAAAQAAEPAAGTEVAKNADLGKGANGESATNGEKKAVGLAAGAEGGEEIANGDASAAVAAAERTRKAWDAVFAPGFEERYKSGGQEHEVCLSWQWGRQRGFLSGCTPLDIRMYRRAVSIRTPCRLPRLRYFSEGIINATTSFKAAHVKCGFSWSVRLNVLVFDGRLFRRPHTTHT